MPAQLIRADALYAGAPYAHAAVAPRGSLVFTAGACPIDEGGTVVAPGDYSAQARQVIANLRTALAAAGCTLDDVLKSTVYVASADRADLLAVWEIVHEAFGEHDAPSTLLGSLHLAMRVNWSGWRRSRWCFNPSRKQVMCLQGLPVLQNADSSQRLQKGHAFSRGPGF